MEFYDSATAATSFLMEPRSSTPFAAAPWERHPGRLRHTTTSAAASLARRPWDSSASDHIQRPTSAIVAAPWDAPASAVADAPFDSSSTVFASDPFANKPFADEPFADEPVDDTDADYVYEADNTSHEPRVWDSSAFKQCFSEFRQESTQHLREHFQQMEQLIIAWLEARCADEAATPGFAGDSGAPPTTPIYTAVANDFSHLDSEPIYDVYDDDMGPLAERVVVDTAFTANQTSLEAFRVDAPPYSIDSPDHRATGRNLPDIISEYIGSELLLQYLSPHLDGEKMRIGANFASTGVGILNDSGPIGRVPAELALHSPDSSGDRELQRAAEMYNPRLLALLRESNTFGTPSECSTRCLYRDKAYVHHGCLCEPYLVDFGLISILSVVWSSTLKQATAPTWEFPSASAHFCINVSRPSYFNSGMPFNCSVKCSSPTISIAATGWVFMATEGFIFDPGPAMVAFYTSQALREPWPPPISMESFLDNAMIRPIAWPNFVLRLVFIISSDFALRPAPWPNFLMSMVLVSSFRKSVLLTSVDRVGVGNILLFIRTEKMMCSVVLLLYSESIIDDAKVAAELVCSFASVSGFMGICITVGRVCWMFMVGKCFIFDQGVPSLRHSIIDKLLPMPWPSFCCYPIEVLAGTYMISLLQLVVKGADHTYQGLASTISAVMDSFDISLQCSLSFWDSIVNCYGMAGHRYWSYEVFIKLWKCCDRAKLQLWDPGGVQILCKQVLSCGYDKQPSPGYYSNMAFLHAVIGRSVSFLGVKSSVALISKGYRIYIQSCNIGMGVAAGPDQWLYEACKVFCQLRLLQCIPICLIGAFSSGDDSRLSICNAQTRIVLTADFVKYADIFDFWRVPIFIQAKSGGSLANSNDFLETLSWRKLSANEVLIYMGFSCIWSEYMCYCALLGQLLASTILAISKKYVEVLLDSTCLQSLPRSSFRCPKGSMSFVVQVQWSVGWYNRIAAHFKLLSMPAHMDVVVTSIVLQSQCVPAFSLHDGVLDGGHGALMLSHLATDVTPVRILIIMVSRFSWDPGGHNIIGLGTSRISRRGECQGPQPVNKSIPGPSPCRQAYKETTPPPGRIIDQSTKSTNYSYQKELLTGRSRRGIGCRGRKTPMVAPDAGPRLSSSSRPRCWRHG